MNYLIALILTIFSISCSTTNVRHENFNQCGEPLLKSRLSTSLDNKNSFPDLTIGLKTLSKANLEIEKYSIGKLNKYELKLYTKAKKLKHYIVHRVPFEKFQTVLSMEALLSPAIASKQNKELKGIITPPMEDELFGGHQCVFMTLGPPKGRDTYGDVGIYFKDQVKNLAWATPWSGWYFVKTNRAIDTDKVAKLFGNKLREVINSNEQRAYSQELYTGNDFGEAFALAIIENIRKLEINESDKTKMIQDLVKIDNPQMFWNEIDDKRLGYFEVKYPEKINFDLIDYIEVPKEYQELLLNHPNYLKWKRLFKFI